MEFQGQRGDPTQAWSVGKFAKRSATIHLNSRDLLGRTQDQHNLTIIEQNTAGLLVQDTSLALRQHIQDAEINASSIVRSVTVDEPRDIRVEPIVDGGGKSRELQLENQGLRLNDPSYTTSTQVNFDDIDHINDGEDAFNIEAPEGANAHAGYETSHAGLIQGNALDSIRALGGLTHVSLANRSSQQTFLTGAVGTENQDGGLRHAMFFPKGDHYPNSGLPNSFALRSRLRNHHFVVLPMVQFVRVGHLGGNELQNLHVPNVEPFRSTRSSQLQQLFKRQILSGYRLELFYSNNVRVVDPEAGAYLDNNIPNTGENPLLVGSNWEVIFTGVPTDVSYKNFGGNAFMVLQFEDDPRLSNLGDSVFDAGRYNSLIEHFNNDPAQGVNAVHFTHPLNSTSTAGIRWNLRQMPQLQVIEQQRFTKNEDHCNYTTSIPNIIGYPEHKRCLLQVQALSLRPSAMSADILDLNAEKQTPQLPLTFGVFLEGSGIQNVFSTVRSSTEIHSEQLAGICPVVAIFNNSIDGLVSYHYTNNQSIVDNGVLTSSPFGRELRVRIVNLTSHSSDDAEDNSLASFKNNPTHLTLRLLFLDDDDLPMR